MKTGSCACGQVSLSFPQFVRPFLGCHCVQCRKQTGTYVTAGHVLDEGLTVTGSEHLTHYRASNTATRSFCKTCGSFLYWKKDGTDYTAVMAGCVDGKTDNPLGAHIFIDEKGDYYELNDGVETINGYGN